MIKKYSEGQIEKVVTPTKENEEKFTQKTREAMDDDKDLVKKAGESGKPFWIEK